MIMKERWRAEREGGRKNVGMTWACNKKRWREAGQ